MKYLDVEGVGSVSRIGLGTWQFGSREWGYGDSYASGPARDIVRRHGIAVRPLDVGAQMECDVRAVDIPALRERGLRLEIGRRAERDDRGVRVGDHECRRRVGREHRARMRGEGWQQAPSPHVP